MASAKQVAANRRNARKSTGPRTEAGKARSRENALKHGLAGEGVVLPVEEAAEVRERMAQWNSSLKPRDAFGMWLLEVVATEAVRVEKCRVRERVLRSEAVARADEGWDEDRRREVEAIAASLPADPPRAVARLRGSLPGCRLLRDWWRGLGRALEAGSAWTADQESLALDLLGVPAPLREGAASPLHAESERGRRSRRSAIVAEEVARLDRLIEEVLPGREERRRESAALDLPEEQPRGVGQCRRYEAQCMRRLRWAREQFEPPPDRARPRTPCPVPPLDEPRRPGPVDAPREPAPVGSTLPPYPWRAPDGSLGTDDPSLPRSLRRILPGLVRSALASGFEGHREARAEAPGLEGGPSPAPDSGEPGRTGSTPHGAGGGAGPGQPPIVPVRERGGSPPLSSVEGRAKASASRNAPQGRRDAPSGIVGNVPPGECGEPPLSSVEGGRRAAPRRRALEAGGSASSGVAGGAPEAASPGGDRTKPIARSGAEIDIRGGGRTGRHRGEEPPAGRSPPRRGGGGPLMVEG